MLRRHGVPPVSSVTFDRVAKRFGSHTALDDFTLDIAEGEFLVLLGPSGCGKSTALRLIAGLDRPTSGRVLIDGVEVSGTDPRDRDVAMVFQSYALYPHLSVFENIESPLLARGDHTGRSRAKRRERAALVDEAAALLGLSEVLRRKPGALSGGQRQRVALARAVVRRPSVFLMDEPLSNLDARLRTDTRLELVDLWRRLGTTFVYVTHDQVEAMTMGTRVAILDGGRLQQVGDPQDVYDEPQNLFVARFAGQPAMNTLDAVVHVAGGVPHAQIGGALVALPPQVRVASGQAVVIGIRSEHLEIDRRGTLAGVVRSVERLGHERHVICDVGGHLIVIRQPTDWAGVRIGDAVRLSMDPHRVHVFDRASGGRVVSQRPAIASLGSRFELLSPEEALALDAAIITAAVEPVVDLTQAELNGETTEVPVVDLTDRPADAGVRRDRDDPPR
jgi:multiple sugar transport system ATP-binding protein